VQSGGRVRPSYPIGFAASVWTGLAASAIAIATSTPTYEYYFSAGFACVCRATAPNRWQGPTLLSYWICRVGLDRAGSVGDRNRHVDTYVRVRGLHTTCAKPPRLLGGRVRPSYPIVFAASIWSGWQRRRSQSPRRHLRTSRVLLRGLHTCAEPPRLIGGRVRPSYLIGFAASVWTGVAASAIAIATSTPTNE
jgi:hypothetical protein